jgi:hypothetical protein
VTLTKQEEKSLVPRVRQGTARRPRKFLFRFGNELYAALRTFSFFYLLTSTQTTPVTKKLGCLNRISQTNITLRYDLLNQNALQ